MSAPKGNNFWLKRSKHGRKLIFESPEIMQAASYEYFLYESKQVQKRQEAIKGGEFAGQLVAVTINNPFTLQGLCIYLHVNTKYFNDFADKLKADKLRVDLTPDELQTIDDFSEVVMHIRDIIDKQKLDGALAGIYNASLTSKLTGLIDRTETSIKGVKDGPPIKVEQITGIDVL